ncbi:ATPase, partial [Bacillus sp. SIMBA_033]
SATIATEVMMYTRKMRSLQIYCSPSINNVDSRIRQLIEVLVQVRKIGNKGFSMRFIDWQAGEFLHKQFLPMYKAKRFFKLNLYDTHEIVQSFPLPSTERDSDTFFKELER